MLTPAEVAAVKDASGAEPPPPDHAPTIAGAAGASPNPVTETTTALSVLGTDDHGEAALVYTWAVVGAAPAAVTFSANDTNDAKATVATFAKAGTYALRATVRDAAGQTTTSDVTVVVSQALTTIVVTPAGGPLPLKGTREFAASARDQFGNDLAVQPAMAWSVTPGGGSITAAGLYAAPVTDGTYEVTATSGGASGSCDVTVANTAPTVATAAVATPSTVSGKTSSLAALGADDAGESALTYTWATIGTPPAAVTFSANGTDAAKSTVATFAKAGTYALRVTIADAGLLSVARDVNVTVNPTLTTVAVSPTAAALNSGQTRQFAAVANDQFGDPMPATFTWALVAAGVGGTVSSTGLYTAPPTGGGTATVRATTGGKSANATVTVTAVPPALSIADVTKNEGNSGTTAFVFTVTRTGATGATSTVKYATGGGDANPANDYTAKSGTLTFAAGETSKTVTVNVTGDRSIETDNKFYVTLAAPTNATLARAQALGLIVNDDANTPTPTPTPTLSINDVSKAEGNSGTTSFAFTVTRAGSTTGTSTVKYATGDGDANPANDYAAASGTLTFAAGQTSKTITVLVTGDRFVEALNTFNVTLSTATGATITRSKALGSILNDD